MPPDYAKVATLANQIKTNLVAIDERIGEIKTYAQSALAQPNEPYYPENYKNMKWSSLADLKKAAEDKAIALDTQKFSTIDAQKIKQEALDALAKAGAIIGETSAKTKSGNNNYRNAEFENSAVQIQNFIDIANQKIKEFEKIGAQATERPNLVTVKTNEQIVSTSRQPLVFPDAEYSVATNYKQLNPYCYDQIATNKSFTRHFANKCLSESWAAGDGKAEKAIATENSCKDKYDVNKKINDQQAFHDCLATNWKSATATLKPINEEQKAKQESIKAAAEPVETKTELTPAQKCQQLIAEYQVPETVRNKKIRSDRRAQATPKQKCVQERWYEDTSKLCTAYPDLAKCTETKATATYRVFITSLINNTRIKVLQTIREINPSIWSMIARNKSGVVKDGLSLNDATALQQQLIAAGQPEDMIEIQTPELDDPSTWKKYTPSTPRKIIRAMTPTQSSDVQQTKPAASPIAFASGTYKVLASGIDDGKKEALTTYLKLIGIDNTDLVNNIEKISEEVIIKDNITEENAKELALQLVQNGVSRAQFGPVDETQTSLKFFLSSKQLNDLQTSVMDSSAKANNLKNTLPNYFEDFNKAETLKAQAQQMASTTITNMQKALANKDDPEILTGAIKTAQYSWVSLSKLMSDFESLQPKINTYQVNFSAIHPNLKDHMIEILRGATTIQNPDRLFDVQGNITTNDKTIVARYNLSREDAMKLTRFLYLNGAKTMEYKKKTANDPEIWGVPAKYISTSQPDIVTKKKVISYTDVAKDMKNTVDKYVEMIANFQVQLKKTILDRVSDIKNNVRIANIIFDKSLADWTLNDKDEPDQKNMLTSLATAKTNLEAAQKSLKMLDVATMTQQEGKLKAQEYKSIAEKLTILPSTKITENQKIQATKYIQAAKASAQEASDLIIKIILEIPIANSFQNASTYEYWTRWQKIEKDILAYCEKMVDADDSINNFYKITQQLRDAPTVTPKRQNSGNAEQLID